VSIAVGGTATAAAVVKNSTNHAVTWSSGNAAVASVSAAGVITGVAPGSTVIRATSAADANAVGLVAVTVTPVVVTISVLPTSASLQVGGEIQLAAQVTGSTAAPAWTTSAAGVATVTNPGGKVTAVAPGTAVITATVGGVSASSVITVTPVVSNVQIVLQPATATTVIGGTIQLVTIITGTSNTGVTYRSSTDSVATVDANGLVTGVKGGTAVITAIAAADTTKKATAVITVSGAPPAPSISIASVVDNDSQVPVNPLSIEGQVDLTVNISAVPENGVRAVSVLVDDDEVCRQNFSTPLGTTQGVATINCPVNTAAVDSSAVPWVARFLNGEHTFYARALDVDGETITEAQFCRWRRRRAGVQGRVHEQRLRVRTRGVHQDVATTMASPIRRRRWSERPALECWRCHAARLVLFSGRTRPCSRLPRLRRIRRRRLRRGEWRLDVHMGGE
jgi:uncharacterized protein YjdB